MKQLIFIIASYFILLTVSAQNESLVFSKVITVDSLSKNEIFDKSLIWCSKAFNDSKEAINVKERDGGIIGGKARYLTPYKVPGKRDSTLGEFFINYNFDWLIEVKDSKLRFTANNILLKELDQEFKVTTSTKPPYEAWLQPKSKTELAWALSKGAFIKGLDALMLSLYLDLVKKEPNW